MLSWNTKGRDGHFSRWRTSPSSVSDAPLRHHAELEHEGTRRAFQQVADEPLVGFSGEGVVPVVDGELHADHVGVLRADVRLHAVDGVVAAGRPDAGIDVGDLALGECVAEPLGENGTPLQLAPRSARARRDGPADDGHDDRLAAESLREHALEAGGVAVPYDEVGVRLVKRRHAHAGGELLRQGELPGGEAERAGENARHGDWKDPLHLSPPGSTRPQTRPRLMRCSAISTALRAAPRSS